MSGKSDDLEAKILDHILGGGDYTRLGTVHVALFTATPSDSGGGTEVTGGSYARSSVTNNNTNFPAATGTNPTSKSNGTAIEFPQASANWGTVTSFAIMSAGSGGDILYWGPLSSSKAVNSGDTASFAIGDLTVTED